MMNPIDASSEQWPQHLHSLSLRHHRAQSEGGSKWESADTRGEILISQEAAWKHTAAHFVEASLGGKAKMPIVKPEVKATLCMPEVRQCLKSFGKAYGCANCSQKSY